MIALTFPPLLGLPNGGLGPADVSSTITAADAYAGIEEILVRLQLAVVQGLNAIIPSIVSALVGFFTRADRHLPLNAVADIEDGK